jgi:glycosyltransferase involved in cell wall biosynthesis
LRRGVERAVDDMRLGGRVHLVGARHDTAAWYAAMDVFALASRWEGLPRVALEALASGLPVASTCTSGMKELGERGAVLSAIGDHRALAQSITSLLERPRCLRIRPAWIEEFSVARMVADTTALYQQLVPTPVLV